MELFTFNLQYHPSSSIYLFFSIIYSGRFKYIIPIIGKRKARGISKDLKSLTFFTNQLVMKSNKKSEETKYIIPLHVYL